MSAIQRVAAPTSESERNSSKGGFTHEQPAPPVKMTNNHADPQVLFGKPRTHLKGMWTNKP
eukprot:2834531-Ditylum_brightwellii.AAC.1